MTDALFLPRDDRDGDGVGQHQPSPSDIALAALITAVSIGTFLLYSSAVMGADPDVPTSDPDLLGVAEVAAAGAALAWRRAYPGLVLTVCVVSSLARFAGGYAVALVPYAVIVAVYTMAERRPARRAVPVCAVVAAVLAIGATAFISAPIDDDTVTVMIAVAAACVVGNSARRRRIHSAVLADQQCALAARAAATERAFIARELHDIVASNIGIISACASAALAGAPGEGGGKTSSTLATIAELARDTLRDMRRMVGVWHAAGQAGAGVAVLDDLPALVTRLCDLGTAVDLRFHGPRVRLPDTVELIAYRIVQESLTNVIKHGPGAAVTVDVTFAPLRLDIVVEDRGGRSAPTPSLPGFGLIGLRERAESHGGTLVAGPTSEGFRVASCLPVPVQAGQR